MLYYIYDDSGNVLGFKYNGLIYYYQKNYQNDIIGIYDSNYNLVVTYKYDAWGKVISVTDTTSNSIGAINPFRYRSYYYDEETKLYYLNSRYYNPEWCRFINADGIIGANQDILSLNLYAYVSNIPSSATDINGNWLLGVVVCGAIIGTALCLALPNSVGMFLKSAVSPQKKSYDNSSVLADSLKKSETMQKITNSNLSDFKNSKAKSKKYTNGNIKTNFYGDGNMKDNDLKLSVGSFNYNMTITDLADLYVIDVHINDKYDFDGYWKIKDMKAILNNLGYFLQNNNVLKTYEWDVHYTIYQEKE